MPAPGPEQNAFRPPRRLLQAWRSHARDGRLAADLPLLSHGHVDDDSPGPAVRGLLASGLFEWMLCGVLPCGFWAEQLCSRVADGSQPQVGWLELAGSYHDHQIAEGDRRRAAAQASPHPAVRFTGV